METLRSPREQRETARPIALITATQTRTTSLNEVLRGKKGVILDKDGVIVNNSRLVFQNLRNGFEHINAEFNFKRAEVSKLNGIDDKFKGTKPILALVAINRLMKNGGREEYAGESPNDVLLNILLQRNAADLLAKLIEKYTVPEDRHVAEAVYWYDRGKFFNAQESAKYIDPYPRAAQAIRKLQKLYNGNVGIFTNAPHLSTTKRDLIRTGLTAKEADSIPIVCKEDVKQPKPHPEGLRMIAGKLGLPHKDLFSVGDSVSDIHCAKNGNMTSVAVSTGAGTIQHLEQAGADIIVHDLYTLTQLIRKTR